MRGFFCAAVILLLLGLLTFPILAYPILASPNREDDSAMKKDFSTGVYAAVLTPLRSDLSCDCEKLASHCSDLIRNGCSGIALFGTTGEGPSFSVTERIETLEKVISEGLDPGKIILGNGSSCISDTVELGRAAMKYGCAALMVAPPSFFKKVTNEGVLSFYREIISKIADPKLRMILNYF